ncbi:MAG: tetratricopeptide repeat protein [Nitrospinae bacterium]|nr:tetratricopeptide repeat protein [Nitrospinota bacterium]
MHPKLLFSRAAAALAFLLACAAPAYAISFFTPEYKKDAAACAEALEKGNYSAAIAAGQKSVEAKKDYFESRHCLGKAYAKAGLASKGIEQLRAALPLAETPNQTMVVNSDLGQLLQQEKEYAKALEHYDTALAYAIVTRDKRTRGLTLANLASVFHEREEDGKALEYYRRAAGEGDEADSGAAWNNMGNILFAQKDFAGALDAYGRAAALGDKLKDDLLTGIALLNTGNVLLAQKNFSAAETKLGAGLAKVQSAKNGYWEAAAHEYFGRLHAAAGNVGKAKEFFGNARDKYRANRHEYEAQQMDMRLRETDTAGPADNAVTAEPLPR